MVARTWLLGLLKAKKAGGAPTTAGEGSAMGFPSQTLQAFTRERLDKEARTSLQPLRARVLKSSCPTGHE